MERATKIFAAVYENTPHPSFEDIVDQFEASLRHCHTGRRTVTYACDDIVLIDMPPLRVGMIWAPASRPGQPHYLIVAVSMLGGDTPDSGTATAAAIEAEILDHLSAQIPYDKLIRTGANRPVDSDLLDRVARSIETFRPLPGNPCPFPAARLPELVRLEEEATTQAFLARAAAAKARLRPDPDSRTADTPAKTPNRRYAEAARPGPRGGKAGMRESLLGAMNLLFESATIGADVLSPRNEPEENWFEKLRTSKLH